MVRSLGLMAITFLCSIGIAAAQQVPTSPVSPEELQQLVPKIPSGSSMGTAKGAVPLGGMLNAPANLTNGFLFYHALNCLWFTDGTNNDLIVFTDAGFTLTIANNVIASQTFLTGCEDGHLQEVNIIDSAGHFNAVVTFPGF